MNTATLTLGGRTFGEGQPCLVVAHVGTAHEGEADVALRLIDAAFQAGADAILFPVFRASDLLARRHPQRTHLEAVELSAREWRKVLQAAKGSGLAVVAEVFDAASRDLAGEAGVDAFQAHADLLPGSCAPRRGGRPLLSAPAGRRSRSCGTP
jgi:sialic acid synthase SpsE